MTTTSTEDKIKIKIIMSERRPLNIISNEWPIIAAAGRHDGESEDQANHKWTIRVRSHRDCRRLVYGRMRACNGEVHTNWRGVEGGFLIPSKNEHPDDDETVRAIRRVAGIIGDDQLAAECIADLPAEDIDAAPAVRNMISMPREGAIRLLATLDWATCVDVLAQDHRKIRDIADELRAALAKTVDGK
jgi:hypothetical protein